MKKITLALAVFTFFLLLFTFYKQQDQLFLATLKMQDHPYTVVLDAGHGGDDPGKIGIDHVLEKDINLAITRYCKKMLEKQNITVILTRNDDHGLYTSTDSNKKTADLKARRRLIEESGAVLAVSIHQNSYPTENVFGGQVFYYSSSAQGKILADYIQASIHELNPQNTRLIKPNSTYYILKSGNCPVVICECGFLSNQEECSKLNSVSYQKDIAKAITRGILSYLYHNSAPDSSSTTEQTGKSPSPSLNRYQSAMFTKKEGTITVPTFLSKNSKLK